MEKKFTKRDMLSCVMSLAAWGQPSRILGSTDNLAADRDRWVIGSTRLHPPQFLTDVAGRQLSQISRIRAALPSFRASHVRAVFVNWSQVQAARPRELSEVDPGNPLYVRSSIEAPRSDPRCFLFGGSYEYEIPSGGVVVSDPLMLGDYTDRDIFYVRTISRVPYGGRRPVSLVPYGSLNEGLEHDVYHDPYRLINGSVGGGGGGGNRGSHNSLAYAPAFLVVLGWDGRQVVMVTGDSVGYGYDDRAGIGVTSRGVEGGLLKGLDRDTMGRGRYPALNICVPGDRASNWIGSEVGKFGRRLEMIEVITRLNHGKFPFTCIWNQHVNNDAGGTDGRALIELMKRWYSFLKNKFPSVPVVALTAVPRVGSGIGTPPNQDFSSVSVQTTSAGQATGTADRYKYNLWLVRKAIQSESGSIGDVELAGVIDWATAFRDPNEQDKFKERSFSAVLVSNVIAGSSVILLDASPSIGELLIIGSGESRLADNAKRFYVVSVSGRGPFIVKLQNVLDKNHSSGEIVRALPTRDGIHPSLMLHDEAAGIIEKHK